MEWREESKQTMSWNGTISNREAKEAVAAQLAAKVQDGQVIGFGSGSTSLLAAYAIAKRVKEEGLNITAIPTSQEMQITCNNLGIPTATLLQKRPDWCFDGADEVDPHGWLIKGRGGAMYREKLVMACSPVRYILVDDSKMVKSLGEKFSIPVECQFEAVNYVREQLFALGAEYVDMRLAKSKDGPVITEHGNFILDARFTNVQEDLESKLIQIVGVVETGLFIGFDPIILCS
ncbi:MAG: ribose 5-phosphate isomerase A [Firmicutes bacterium]|nr:ribose 5-phosphate isomerase A [Bacillota bacterium]